MDEGRTMPIRLPHHAARGPRFQASGSETWPGALTRRVRPRAWVQGRDDGTPGAPCWGRSGDGRRGKRGWPGLGPLEWVGRPEGRLWLLGGGGGWKRRLSGGGEGPQGVIKQLARLTHRVAGDGRGRGHLHHLAICPAGVSLNGLSSRRYAGLRNGLEEVDGGRGAVPVGRGINARERKVWDHDGAIRFGADLATPQILEGVG
jgi:hypothetical protein